MKYKDTISQSNTALKPIKLGNQSDLLKKNSLNIMLKNAFFKITIQQEPIKNSIFVSNS
jgi:hypothetical protein